MDFEQYVAERGRALERFAFVLTGDVHHAQDLTQIALLKAYRRWSSLRRTDHPDVYVRRIVVSSLIDWRRRRSAGERPVPDPPDSGRRYPDPADVVVARDSLARGLAGLPPAQRAVLVLRHLEGYDDDAIARVLGCSAVTVRSHASRGLHRLRELLGAQGVTNDSWGSGHA